MNINIIIFNYEIKTYWNQRKPNLNPTDEESLIKVLRERINTVIVSRAASGMKEWLHDFIYRLTTSYKELYFYIHLYVLSIT